MDFTFAEIDYLISRGWLDEDKANTFGIDYAVCSTNQGFGHRSLTKKSNGKIEYSYSTPINVDPDDASYDIQSGIFYYKDFEHFVKGNHYKKR